MNIKEEKRQLRNKIMKRIAELSKDYTLEADKKIYEKVINLKEYKEAKIIFCFVSTEDEINTRNIIENALESGKRVGVPKCIGKGIMEVHEIKGYKSLKNGKYGILEPKDECPLIMSEEIDFAIIPCVSCNMEGYRLGYGGGFYDRYLEHVTFATAVICREKITCDYIPYDEHDVKIHKVITDR
ncbi:5-formyltetrahydrofolate cyclo-ligase [Clostridium sp. UBA7503]|uniref:5-formyltetrahydrofolate cyclo-ligase n=1 Tax=Clostridium sp. UBA7503 TaxID=1946377 RepID=UPI0032179DF5